MRPATSYEDYHSVITVPFFRQPHLSSRFFGEALRVLHYIVSMAPLWQALELGPCTFEPSEMCHPVRVVGPQVQEESHVHARLSFPWVWIFHLDKSYCLRSGHLLVLASDFLSRKLEKLIVRSSLTPELRFLQHLITNLSLPSTKLDHWYSIFLPRFWMMSNTNTKAWSRSRQWSFVAITFLSSIHSSHASILYWDTIQS